MVIHNSSHNVFIDEYLTIVSYCALLRCTQTSPLRWLRVLFLLREWFCCCWFFVLWTSQCSIVFFFSMHFFLSFKVFQSCWRKRERVCICFNRLSDILWLLVFWISSLWWPGLDCSVWLWHFLIMLTYFLPKMEKRTLWPCDMYNKIVSNEHTLLVIWPQLDFLLSHDMCLQSNKSCLDPKVKCQSWPLVVTDSHCLIRLNISNK